MIRNNNHRRGRRHLGEKAGLHHSGLGSTGLWVGRKGGGAKVLTIEGEYSGGSSFVIIREGN